MTERGGWRQIWARGGGIKISGRGMMEANGGLVPRLGEEGKG